MANITYSAGVLTVDGVACPEASIVALVSRGETHLFGSEASSKLIGKVKKALTDAWIAEGSGNGEARAAKDAPEWDKAQTKAWRDANVGQVSAWAAEIEADYVKVLQEGTIGQRVGGAPRLDPLEAKIESLAKEWVKTNVMEANSIKPAQYAKDKPVNIGGTDYTFSQIVERCIKAQRDRLEKDARKYLAEQARKAEKARETAKTARTLEDLGL